MQSLADRYDRRRARARENLEHDAHGDGEDAAWLRLLDAYADAYSDAKLWHGTEKAILNMFSQSYSPRGDYDGVLPVPTECVGEAISTFEDEWGVTIHRVREPAPESGPGR